jgi:hypothetical protein
MWMRLLKMDEIMLKRQDFIFTKHFPNLLLASGSDKSTWHVQNQPHRAF